MFLCVKLWIKDMNEEFLNKKLQERKDQNAYRQLQLPNNKIDFCSNDYLGIVRITLNCRQSTVNCQRALLVQDYFREIIF